MSGFAVDVARLKEAEEARRASDARHQNLFNSINAGLCFCQMILDDRGKPVDYRFLEINPKFEEQTGLQGAAGRTARELVPDLEEHWFELYGRVALTGEPARFMQGSAVMGRWFEVYAFRTGQPQELTFAILFNDVTERRRLEVERERFLAVGSDLQVINGTDGYFRWVNPAWEKTFGWTLEEMRRTPWSDFVHPDDLGATITEAEDSYTGKETLFFENRYRCRDGSYRWLHWRTQTYVEENLIYAVAIDVTERKRAERKLRDSDERFRTLADNIPQLAWMARPDGHIFWYNRRWYEYTGMDPESQEGWGWQSVHDPGVLPSVLEGWRQSIATGEPFSMVFPLQGADGIFRPFLTRVMPVKDEQGRVERWFGTNTDITEQLAAETALREADRRKDEFLAMLAHELRNPLAPIRNATQVLKMLGPTDAHQQWAREIIERQTQHLTRLVDDLLDVSRITRGKVTLACAPLDLATVVHRAVEASRPLIDARGHQLTVALPAEPVRVEGDPTRLVQAAGNLLNNAAKYTDEGGHVRIEAAGEGDEAVLRVTDNGIGVAADLLPHVFDLFTQADRTLDRSQGGLGIGLTLVRQLVELHGGRVEASSAGPGQGSEFTIRLPAMAPTS